MPTASDALAHNLKSVAAHVSAGQLREIAFEIEQAGARRDIQFADRHRLARLDEEVRPRRSFPMQCKIYRFQPGEQCCREGRRFEMTQELKETRKPSLRPVPISSAQARLLTRGSLFQC